VTESLAYISPVSFIEHLLSVNGSVPAKVSELFIITGSSGSGKTTWCQQLCVTACARGVTVCGFISPAVYSEGHKVAIDLLDLVSGESRRLAVSPRVDSSHDNTRELNRPGLNWQFDESVINWGNTRLAALPAADLFIFDELGPLEFTYGSGLMAAFPVLAARKYAISCVVIRPALLQSALFRWPWGQVVACVPGLSLAEHPD